MNKSVEATRHTIKNDSGFALIVFRLISFFETGEPLLNMAFLSVNILSKIPEEKLT